MLVLVLGLVVFLGSHSVRIFADPWRTRQIERLGEKRWKFLYSAASLAGFVLIIWGYGMARREPVVLWAQPVWAVHLAALLTLLAFILFPAAHIPGNHFKAWVKHPMVVGVGLWAFAHLVANGTLNAVVLFGAFLVWAVVDYVAAVRRDAALGVVYPAGVLRKDLMAVVGGGVVWVVFVLWLHGWLIGVRPFG
ncbi:MAG: NnrU family protein [Paraburkholderia sp.]|uniref:NnrU family protein n=1 Tax=Paraburkholderia sp. TaxID=1926495 RepID=UPI003C38981A